MTNRGAVTITPGATAQAIPAGYHNGSGSVPAISISSVAAGDNLIYNSTNLMSTPSGSYKKMKEIGISVSGVVRVIFSLINSGTPGVAYGRIYVNDIAVGTERMESYGTETTFSEDITVAANDLISIYIRRYDTSTRAYLRNFQLGISLALPTILGDFVYAEDPLQ
jgi:hypothetical protein